MAESAGSIHYSVDIETQDTLDAQKKLDKGFDSMQASMDKTDKSAKGLDATLNKTTQGIRRANTEANAASGALAKLGGAIAAAATLRLAMTIIATADAYGEMAERLQMVSASTEEYDKIQRRLLASANATYRPLAEAQELFVRTADTLRSLGYNTNQALDITDSFSLALVRNAASGMRAESAISAMSKSFQSGRVAADQWESILSAVPTIVDDISLATGKTTTEIRQMGVAGELTGFQLAEGLRKGHDQNAQAAADMAVTVKDAYNNLINTLTVYIGEANKASGATNVLAKAMEAMTNGFRFSVGMLTDQEKLNELHRERQKIVESLAASEGTWRENMPGALALRENLKKLESEILAIQERRIAEQKEEGATPTEAPAQTTSAGGQKALQALREQAELARMSGEARAKLAAIQKLGAEATADEREEAEKLAAEIYRLDEAQKASGKSASAAASAAKKHAAELEKNTTLIAGLKEALYQATLPANELAMRQAELSLNQYATPEQIAQIRTLSSELQHAQELQAKQKAFGSTETEVTTKITGQVAPLSGGMFDDQTARYEAEAEAERVRYEEQLARLNEAKTLELEVKGGYFQLEEDLAQQHADRMAQIEQAKNDIIMQSAASAFGQMSTDLMDFANTFGQENSKMLAVAKAAAIAQTIISTYEGAQKAFTAMAGIPYVGPALGAAAAGAAIAGGMARVAAIRSSGGRAQGGPVQADNMYRINETGGPEIFNAANGRQYMMPNQRGEVVSNKDATGNGGGANVVVNITNNTGQKVTQSETQMDDKRVIDIIVGDIMGDGKTSKAIQRTTGTRRVGA